MKRVMHKAGMIFFVLVISCLIAFGCVFTMNVTESNSDNIVNAGTQNNFSANNSGESASNSTGESYTTPKVEVPEIPKSEYDFKLGHKAECTNQANCTCMQDIWNEAIQKSLDSGKNVKVTLMNDWVARVTNDNMVTAFGKNGIGFENGRLAIPIGANLTLDLNGKSIDKNVPSNVDKPTTAILRIYGITNIMDSKYSFEQAYAVYNAYKDSSVEDELYNKFKELSFGRFTGNDSIGGASGIHVDGELNFYGGMIIGNHTIGTVGGVTVRKNAVLNFYDGLIIGNKGADVGGIQSQDCKQMNIFNGIIACNENLVPNANLADHAGGIAFDGTNSDFNIYGGIISNNKSATRAGGVMVKAAKVFQFVGGEIVNNHSTLYGGGIYVYKTKYALLQNAKISNNISDGSTGGVHLNTIEKAFLYNMEITNNQATGQGGAVFIDGNISNIEMDNTRIANNMALDGSGIYILNGQVQLKNTFVVDNESTSTNSVGAITLNKDAGNIFVKCGVVIANNIDGNNKGADVYLSKNQKIIINGSLNEEMHTARIGVVLADNYGEDNVFTSRYAIYSHTLNHAYFFSSNTNYRIKNINGELALDTENLRNQTITWYVTPENGERITISEGVATLSVNYTGKKFSITSSLSNFIYNNNVMTSVDCVNVGQYHCRIDNNGMVYKNTVFVLDIQPKEVDIVWDNLKLDYNGNPQLPKASITENENCTISVVGEQINAGNKYVATATTLSDKNYKISAKSKSTTYDILPANLTIKVVTNGSGYIYNGKEIKLPNNWYKLSAELLGQDSGKSLDSIFDIDYSKIIPQFTKDSLTSDSAVNVGEYAISVKPFNVNEVFSGNNNYNVVINYVNGGTLSITESQVIRPSVESQYEYLVLEDDKRVAYSEKELVHGENDSDVNISNGKANYYLGNIAPNTSVNKFISNLVYDKTQIQIYNNKDEIIYNKGNAEVSAELLDNGIELAIGTGWYIEYMVGSKTERITLSVLGDINGDGRISAKDVATLREIANNKAVYENLSVEQKLASMIVNKGGVSTADSEIVRNVIDKLFDINLFF